MKSIHDFQLGLLGTDYASKLKLPVIIKKNGVILKLNQKDPLLIYQ